jgi:hypothetical protein
MIEAFTFFKSIFFIVAYGITLILSLVYYKKYFNTVLKYFPILIAYTFLNELLGNLVRYSEYFSFFAQSEHTYSNSFIYNIFDIIFFGYFFYVYWRLSQSKRIKNLIVFFAIIALLANIINAIFYDPMEIALFYANAVSCWILVAFSIQYLNQLRPHLKWKVQRYNLMFWISIGLVLFHLFFPFLFITGYLKPEVWYKFNLQTIVRILIIIMYALFSIGFIVSRKKSFV